MIHAHVVAVKNTKTAVEQIDKNKTGDFHRSLFIDM